MYSIPKVFAFFVTLAFLIAFFKDMTLGNFAKEDFRRTAQAAVDAVVTRHMDWAALRVGDPPYLIRDGVEDTIQRVIDQNIDVNADRIKAHMYFQSQPAIIGLVLDSNYNSSILSLTGEDEIDITVPARAVQIIESKYTTKNY